MHVSHWIYLYADKHGIQRDRCNDLQDTFFGNGEREFPDYVKRVQEAYPDGTRRKVDMETYAQEAR